MTTSTAWTPEALEKLLAFYAEAGVDVALSDAPADRLGAPEPEPWRVSAGARRAEAAPEPSTAAPAPASPRPRPEPRPSPARPEPAARRADAPVSDADPVMAAREAAASAPTLDALRETLERFEGCSLRFTATNLVFSDGNPEARVMLVGEAPGAEEDARGLPFVGRAGRLLDRMLAAIGLDRSSVYIANAVPWRPPSNATPTPQQTEICRPFIARQIALADPDILVLLGNVAAKQLLETKEGILRLRGRWRPYDTGARTIRAIPMLHPAYLLRRPLEKRLAWRDLLALKAALDEERRG